MTWFGKELPKIPDEVRMKISLFSFAAMAYGAAQDRETGVTPEETKEAWARMRFELETEIANAIEGARRESCPAQPVETTP